MKIFLIPVSGRPERQHRKARDLFHFYRHTCWGNGTPTVMVRVKGRSASWQQARSFFEICSKNGRIPTLVDDEIWGKTLKIGAGPIFVFFNQRSGQPDLVSIVAGMDINVSHIGEGFLAECMPESRMFIQAQYTGFKY